MFPTRRAVGAALAGLATLGMAGTAMADPTPVPAADPAYSIPAAIPASGVDKVASWQDMKFAMFIHWGVYSHYAGWYKGEKQEVGYPEQIKAWGHQQTWDRRIPLQGIPRDEYLATAQAFDAADFDATAWCQQAKDTGMRMLLITSKHHDGFAMWDTATTDYNFTKQSPSHRDPLLELSQACKQVGIKFGLYFSNIDWEKQPENPWMNDNTLDEEGYMDYIHAQLKELLGGKYGDIAELWYDMGKPNPAQSDQLRAWAHELQPDIMINSRVGNDRADFEVGWDNELQTEQTQGPWESAVSIFPKCWGYCEWDDAAPKFKDTGYPDYSEEDWDHMVDVDNETRLRKDPDGVAKKTTETLTNLFNTAALGGQFLFNVGPKFDGSYNQWDASVLRAIGEWNAAHPGVLTNSRPAYFPIEDWGKTMVDDSHIYMGVQKWQEGAAITLRGAGANTIESVTLDGTGQALPHEVRGNDLVVTLPARPDDHLPVIAVKTAAAPVYVPVGLTAVEQGTTTIADARLEKFKAPTPKTGETQVIASLTSGDKRAEGVSLAFEATGLTDDYAAYKVTVGDQEVRGLTTADLAKGVGSFTLEAGRTYRATLSYDDPYYPMKGFGKDAKVSSVTVTAATVKAPASIAVSPASVTAGGTVTITGKDFTPGGSVALTLHSDLVGIGTATAGSDGAFTAEATVPAGTAGGDHQVVAVDSGTGESASAPLAVVVPVPDPSGQSSDQSGAVPSADGASPGGDLARTGSSALPVVLGAALAAGAGTLLTRRSRRARS